ncbi:hypothetical protein WUBG_17880, partial [Wuchereria bancrofti]
VGKLSCGRVEVPRLEIEHLSNEEVLQYAIDDAHSIFFQELASFGFYVLLEVKFNKVPAEETLIDILKQTRAQRLKVKRARKKAEK